MLRTGTNRIVRAEVAAGVMVDAAVAASVVAAAVIQLLGAW